MDKGTPLVFSSSIINREYPPELFDCTILTRPSSTASLRLIGSLPAAKTQTTIPTIQRVRTNRWSACDKNLPDLTVFIGFLRSFMLLIAPLLPGPIQLFSASLFEQKSSQS